MNREKPNYQSRNQSATYNKFALFNKTYNPEKEISDETINKLFTTLLNGNYSQIKQYILENHTSMGLKNKDFDKPDCYIIEKNDKIRIKLIKTIYPLHND